MCTAVCLPECAVAFLYVRVFVNARVYMCDIFFTFVWRSKGLVSSDKRSDLVNRMRHKGK